MNNETEHVESRVRDKNEVTIPIPIRVFLRVKPGDLVRWETGPGGVVFVCKVITKKIHGKQDGGE